MTKTVLAEVDGFTPVIDRVTSDVGPVASLVFGAVWRYCQAKGVCTASLHTLSERCGLSRATMIRHLRTLVEAGYIERRDVPGWGVEYRDTGKAAIAISVTAQVDGGGIKMIPGGCQNDTQRYNLRDNLIDNKDIDLQQPPPSQPEKPVEPDPYLLMVEQATGLTVSPADIETINTWQKLGVQAAHIAAAIEWRKASGLSRASRISKLRDGVVTEFNKSQASEKRNQQQPSSGVILAPRGMR